ncbi:MAG: helix-turn-helix domain-containing protein [Candidatus Kapabacteria bacterium]|nr:helix-turn-helix domain-containing protein [Candidatus Kapabacteria bacterium]
MDIKKDKTKLVVEFGERLEDWITATWQSQSVFAKRSGYTAATINSYCKGRTFPDIVFLNLIHDLGADLNALITGHSLEAKPHSSSLPHVERLKSWIVKYFGTIPNLLSTNSKLLETMQIPQETLLKFVYGQLSYDPTITDFFNAIGCNMHWVMTGEGAELIVSHKQKQTGVEDITDALVERIQQGLFDKLTEADISKLSNVLTQKLMDKFISVVTKKDI